MVVSAAAVLAVNQLTQKYQVSLSAQTVQALYDQYGATLTNEQVAVILRLAEPSVPVSQPSLPGETLARQLALATQKALTPSAAAVTNAEDVFRILQGGGQQAVDTFISFLPPALAGGFISGVSSSGVGAAVGGAAAARTGGGSSIAGVLKTGGEVVASTTFALFIFEESMQAAGFQITTAIQAGDAKQARAALENYKKLQETTDAFLAGPGLLAGPLKASFDSFFLATRNAIPSYVSRIETLEGTLAAKPAKEAAAQDKKDDEITTRMIAAALLQDNDTLAYSLAGRLRTSAAIQDAELRLQKYNATKTKAAAADQAKAQKAVASSAAKQARAIKKAQDAAARKAAADKKAADRAQLKAAQETAKLATKQEKERLAAQKKENAAALAAQKATDKLAAQRARNEALARITIADLQAARIKAEARLASLGV